MKSLVPLSTAIIIASLGCHSVSESPPRYSRALIVLPNAREVKFGKYNGSDQLSYTVEVEYPASEQISTISKKLAENGWKPLREDWLNPGLKSSHTRGWTDFEDVSRRRDLRVFQWLAQWDDKAGDVVAYAYQYRDQLGPARHRSRYFLRKEPGSHKLRVMAVYFPAKLAEKIKKGAHSSEPHPKNSGARQKALP